MESVRIFEEEKENETTEVDMESVRSMVKQMTEIDEEISSLRDDKKELISDFVDTHNVPKKEVMLAIRMLKSDVDPELTSDVYANIADLIDV